MKPLVIDMIEILLRKGETIKMTTLLHGDVEDGSLVSVSLADQSFCSDAVYFFYFEFFKHPLDKTREWFSNAEIDAMTLEKRGDSWMLFL